MKSLIDLRIKFPKTFTKKQVQELGWLIDRNSPHAWFSIARKFEWSGNMDNPQILNNLLAAITNTYDTTIKFGGDTIVVTVR